MEYDFELVVVGDGPLFRQIGESAVSKLGKSRIVMLGRLPMDDVCTVMRSLDCLVLPSDHDGWGVVVTEAMAVGVPTICSDACGAALAVEVSGLGGVFPKGNGEQLKGLMETSIQKGPIRENERIQLFKLARTFCARAGARYTGSILETVYGCDVRPEPPWQENVVQTP